jgi:hypothetical protein
MKTKFLTIIVVGAIVAVIVGFFAFEKNAAEVLCIEQGGVISGDLCILENPYPQTTDDIKELSIDDISFMAPNSMEYFYYPNPEDTQNRDEFQRFMLIRLPEHLGGAADDVSAFRAYSAISISADHCISKYWPDPGRQRMEDPCWGTMYRALDGAIIQNTDPVMITSPMALPRLDLSIDDTGALYVEPPEWTVDENGVVGFGRSMSVQEVRQGSEIIAESLNKPHPNHPQIPAEFAGYLLAEVNPYNSRTEARYYDFASMGNDNIHITTSNVSAQDQKYFMNFAKPNIEFWKIGETIIQVGGSALDPDNDQPERYQSYEIQFILDGFKYTISGNDGEILKRSMVTQFFPEHQYDQLSLISNSPSDRTILLYTENHNVPFDYEGRIDYDVLIKKILPPLFQEKLKDMGVDVQTSHMVLLRGPQISMYQESSYQCGYVIDDDKSVYWLEGRINDSKIHDVNVFAENPMPCKPNHSSCWCTAHTLAEEELLDFEKTGLTVDEEKIVVNYIYDYLKDNTNLNFYKYQVGKYHMDYGDENVISFCGVFGQETPRDYFGGSVNTVTNETDFHMEQSLSPLCVISDYAKWNSFEGEIQR